MAQRPTRAEIGRLGEQIAASFLADRGYSVEMKNAVNPAGYTGASLEVLLGFFVMHYYVESQVWKFRRAHNRETTLPLLRQPSPV